MPYDPEAVKGAYDDLAEEEDRAEKQPSLRETVLSVVFLGKTLRRGISGVSIVLLRTSALSTTGILRFL